MKQCLFAIAALLLLAIPASAANRFAVCTTTCTWDGASTAMWSTTTGGATGASVPGSADAVIIDNASCVGGTTCTITVNTNFNVATISMTACNASTTGCILDFSVNNNTVTIGTSFATSGTSNGIVKLGSATINITPTTSVTVWNFASAGTTLQAGTSIINISGTTVSTRSFSGGVATYATVNILANTSSGQFTFNTGGPSSFGTVTVAPPNSITWGSSNTVNTAFSLNGTNVNQITMQSAALGSAVTFLGNPTTTITWSAIRDISFTNAVTATNTMDLGNNTNISFGGSGGGCIIGGWLLWRDLPEHINDNFPAWIEKAA